MFEFLKRKKVMSPQAIAGGAPLYFRDGTAAIEYACTYLECPLGTDAYLPGVVLDSRALFGTQTAVSVDADGIQTAVLRVAAPGGGFIVPAPTAGPKGPTLQVGQMVLWQALVHSASIEQKMGNAKSGWVGHIVATLQPEYDSRGWVGGERYSS